MRHFDEYHSSFLFLSIQHVKIPPHQSMSFKEFFSNPIPKNGSFYDIIESICIVAKPNIQSSNFNNIQTNNYEGLVPNPWLTMQDWVRLESQLYLTLSIICLWQRNMRSNKIVFNKNLEIHSLIVPNVKILECRGQWPPTFHDTTFIEKW